MTIRFMFNSTERAFEITPDNTLEEALLKDMADQCAKGSRIDLKSVISPFPAPSNCATRLYRVELVVPKV